MSLSSQTSTGVLSGSSVFHSDWSGAGLSTRAGKVAPLSASTILSPRSEATNSGQRRRSLAPSVVVPTFTIRGDATIESLAVPAAGSRPDGSAVHRTQNVISHLRERGAVLVPRQWPGVSLGRHQRANVGSPLEALNSRLNGARTVFLKNRHLTLKATSPRAVTSFASKS